MDVTELINVLIISCVWHPLSGGGRPRHTGPVIYRMNRIYCFFIGTDNNVMFRIWARKDALDQIAYAKEVGPKMLEYFEEYFNVTYPLPKQDMIAIPDFRSVHVFTEQF